MLRIGITGGIGCGKSVVASMLSGCGIPVFDCDSEARVVMSDPSIRSDLSAATGIDFYPDGTLDKKMMSDFIFADGANAAIVNSVVHPAVRKRYREWCGVQLSNGLEICAVESAILLEAGMRDDVDILLVVDAPESIRMERVARRDSTTAERVEERMRAQMPQCVKVASADYVITNDGDMAKLKESTEEFLNSIGFK